jgi:hypothetical protein
MGSSFCQLARISSCSCLLVALTMLAAGCGKDPPPTLVSVKGKVIGYNGQSVKGAKVSLWPQYSESTHVRLAVCEEDGSFSLECPKGLYKVTVTPARVGVAAVPGPSSDGGPIPERYQDSRKTPLQAHVLETGLEEVVFKLE